MNFLLWTTALAFLAYQTLAVPISPKVLRAPALELESNATFVAGSAIPPLCSVDYGNEVRTRAQEVQAAVSSRLGGSLCASDPLDWITTNYVLFLESERRGLVQVDFLLYPRDTATPGEVEACGDEITLYVNDFDNWRQPIIPPVSGCPDVSFTTNMWNSLGRFWACAATANKEE